IYISEVTIRNFRIFDQVGIDALFKKGTNALISENNCGKSVCIDALRIAFSTTHIKRTSIST
ncbi:MAG: AAA family ATPase, partial [Oscillospiraceae bacterium]